MENLQTILITGASSGIGKALALAYAQPGRTLVLSGRNQGRLDDVVRQCQEKGAQARGSVVDVTDRKEMADWMIMVDNQNPVDLVIANAGISGGTGGCSDSEPEEQVREIFDINVTGVLNTIDPLLPRMIKRGRGQIALMSSLAGFSSWPGAPAYSASKAAIRVYGEALSGSLAGTGVKINVICPGFITTPLTDVNNHKMPLIMDVDRAAKIIIVALERDVIRIAFPFVSYVVAGFLGMWPVGLALGLLKRLPKKPSYRM